MSIRDLPTPRLPGISVDVDLPRWLPKAIRIGLVMTIVFILATSVLVDRFGGPGDSGWSSPGLFVDRAYQQDTGVWSFDVLVVAGTDGGSLGEGWSIVLSNGAIIPAISHAGDNLKAGETREIRVTAIYANIGQPAAGHPISLRWDPNGKLGTRFPLNLDPSR